MLHDDRQAIVVDPGDAGPVAAALDARNLAPVAILVTHHHSDPVGGLAALWPRLHAAPSALADGPARAAVPQPFPPVAEGASPLQPSRPMPRWHAAPWPVARWPQVGQPTLPSTIAQARAIDPFMRCDVPDVNRCPDPETPGAADHSRPAVPGPQREWKNQVR